MHARSRVAPQFSRRPRPAARPPATPQSAVQIAGNLPTRTAAAKRPQRSTKDVVDQAHDGAVPKVDSVSVAARARRSQQIFVSRLSFRGACARSAAASRAPKRREPKLRWLVPWGRHRLLAGGGKTFRGTPQGAMRISRQLRDAVQAHRAPSNRAQHTLAVPMSRSGPRRSPTWLSTSAVDRLADVDKDRDESAPFRRGCRTNRS